MPDGRGFRAGAPMKTFAGGVPVIAVGCRVEAGDWPPPETLVPVFEEALSAAARAAGLAEGGEVSILLTDDRHMRVLNAAWRGKDRATNVLSFPALGMAQGGGPTLLGDIVLARETLQREAEAQGKPFEHHLAHLLVHGFLHLLGYDHQTRAEAEAMEGMERRVLESLAIGDPYA